MNRPGTPTMSVQARPTGGGGPYRGQRLLAKFLSDRERRIHDVVVDMVVSGGQVGWSVLEEYL